MDACRSHHRNLNSRSETDTGIWIYKVGVTFTQDFNELLHVARSSYGTTGQFQNRKVRMLEPPNLDSPTLTTWRGIT